MTNDLVFDTRHARRWRVLALLAAAELLGMALWFSGSAVVPALSREWELSPSQISWLANAVQLGFVAGTLISATLNLPDIHQHQTPVCSLLISRRRIEWDLRFLRHGSRISDRSSFPHWDLPRRRLPSGHEDHGDVVSRATRNGARCFGRCADDGKSDALSRQCVGKRKLAIQRALCFAARGDRRTHRAFLCRGWSICTAAGEV